MQEKHKIQVGVIALLAGVVWFFQIRNWGNISQCTLGYKLWAPLVATYFLIIRVIELLNLNTVLSNKKLQLLFLGVFLPTYLIWTILGFRWFITASISKCNDNDSFASLGMMFLSVLRCILFLVLALFLFKDRRFLARYHETRQENGLNDSIERINMDRLNRDYRRAIDFESMEVDHEQDPDQRLLERQKGLTGEQIKRLEITRITAENFQEYKNIGQCSICLNDFSMKDKTKRLPLCQHAFHEKCIDNWLRRARECPLCKRCVLQEEGLVPAEFTHSFIISGYSFSPLLKLVVYLPRLSRDFSFVPRFSELSEPTQARAGVLKSSWV